MRIRAVPFFSVLLFAGSCGERSSYANPPVSAPTLPLLRGAAIGADGTATILDAPPAPFTPTEPGAPKPLTPEQLTGYRQFARAGNFQNEVREEVQAVVDKLRTREKGNFVDLYFENEGDPRVVFRFLRTPKETLARYTRHPRFFAEPARYTDRQLEAALDFMFRTFREDRVILSGGTGNKRNRAVVEIAVPEPEFRALVARKRVTIPDGVVLEFVVTQPANTLNRPLPPEIARVVRIFPRDDRPVGALHSIDSTAKVVLRNGCFQVDGGVHEGALVQFPLGARLFVDSQGYLAFGESEIPGYARVGETIVTPGSIGEVTAPDLLAPIRKACGEGKVVKIHAMRSDAADSAQQRVSTNAQSLRYFRENYGLSEDMATKVLEGCKSRMGFGTCHRSPPPPPPPGGLTCPVGTKPAFGMCRTPEGYARPIPAWIQELMK